MSAAHLWSAVALECGGFDTAFRCESATPRAHAAIDNLADFYGATWPRGAADSEQKAEAQPPHSKVLAQAK